jgi:hypothetical protein
VLTEFVAAVNDHNRGYYEVVELVRATAVPGDKLSLDSADQVVLADLDVSLGIYPLVTFIREAAYRACRAAGDVDGAGKYASGSRSDNFDAGRIVSDAAEVAYVGAEPGSEVGTIDRLRRIARIVSARDGVSANHVVPAR